MTTKQLVESLYNNHYAPLLKQMLEEDRKQSVQLKPSKPVTKFKRIERV